MAKSSFGTNVYGPDSSFIEGIGNIASMFDPKAQAAAALQKAHQDYYGNQSRLATANAIAAEDQNNALSENALAAAGYTPIQIAAIRATRTKSVTDLFRGVNLNTGANIIQDPNGDKRVGMTLLGQGAAASNPNFAFTPEEADAVRLSNAFAKPINVNPNQDVVKINPDGSSNVLYQADRFLAPGHTAYSTTSTGLEPITTAPVPAGSGRTTDPIRHANAVRQLQNGYNNNLLRSVSPLDATGMNYALLPDPAQADSITSYAIGLVQDGKVPAERALYESAKAHGVTLNLTAIDPDTKKFRNFHLPVQPVATPVPATPPVTSNLSRTVVGSPGGAAATNDGDPTDTEDATDAETETTDETTSPTGLIRITNDAAGRATWESLAPGTQFISPDGQTRIK